MPKRILVADDDADVRFILQDYLSAWGFSVDTATNGLEALEKLSRATYDGLLLDIMMPGLDGLEVLQQVRQRYPSLPVVMITGVAFELAAQALQAGAQAYLVKPFQVEHVRQVVERWCNPLTVRRILVVDDDPDIREILKDSLESYRYAVDTAATGREALEKLQQATYGGMLLDILLPEMSGLEVLRRVRQQYPSLPVIMITAVAQESAIQALESGAQAYLLKPFDTARVKQLVEFWFGPSGGEA